MRVSLFSFCLLFIFTFASCQELDHEKIFVNFISKFNTPSFPIVCPGGCSDRASNDPNNITKEEFEKFLLANDDIWIYDYDFYYNTGCRFKIESSFIGLIYFRAYLPENIMEEKAESVLCIFNKKGQLISSLPIQGGIGDDLTFRGEINEKYEITIWYTEYSLDKDGESIIKKRTEHYKILPLGKIEKM